jgi:hypothetical protein
MSALASGALPTRAAADEAEASGRPVTVKVLLSSRSDACYDPGDIPAIKKLARLEQRRINESGGVAGRKLHVEFLDDQRDNQRAVGNVHAALSDPDTLAVIGLVTLPATPTVALIYGAVTGLLWLSSVPPTSGLVAVMFGTRWLAMLFGIAFFSHQVGGFLGVYLGGFIYERTGSYDIVWWLGVMFGVLSAIINLPIVEKPVARLAAAPA